MSTFDAPTPASVRRTTSSPAMLTIAWLLVGVPLAWGVLQTLKQSAHLFRAPQQTSSSSSVTSGSAPPAPSH